MLGRLADFDAIDAGAGRRFPDVSKTFWGFYDIVEATSEHTYTFDSELLHEKWNQDLRQPRRPVWRRGCFNE